MSIRIKTKTKWCLLGIGVLLFIAIYIGCRSHLHIDFSQTYRGIRGYEGIVFRDNWSEQTYRRCVWGLVKKNASGKFAKHFLDRESEEYKLLSERVDVSNITQLVSSPDGVYILYVENVYRGSGVTDDEDVYFKVYDTQNDTVTTIYSGHREFLSVDWQEWQK